MQNTKLPTNLNEQPPASIVELVTRNVTLDVDKLSTDAQTLFGLLTLVVDIRYRVKYGSSFGEQMDKRYSEATMKDEHDNRQP
jgi:hypothetical protein